MKAMRKVTSIMLAIMMVLGVMSPVMAEIGGEVTKVITVNGLDAGSKLVDAGVLTGYEDGSLGLEKGINRAQLVVLIDRAVGKTEGATHLTTSGIKFKDVSENMWYTESINSASDRGWVNGDTEGNFRPLEDVQFREALTMLMGALGYTNDNLGGQWPTNFIDKAIELELTGGVDYSIKDKATRGDIVELIDRAYDYKNNTLLEGLKYGEDREVIQPVDVVEQERPIGIITAMTSELKLLVEKSEIERVETIGNVEYHVGTLEGKNVVLVKAGVGKSLSSAGTAILIHEFNVSNIIFTGIAGAVKDEINVLDMVIATDLLIHDYGQQTDEGFVWNGKAGVDRETGIIPIDEKLMNLAYEAAIKVAGKEHTHKGRIVTGDQFVGSKSYVEELSTKFNAYAAEMEGASVGRVAYEFGIPTIVIRSMSDKADGVARESMDNFGQKAADMSAMIVMELLKTIK